MANNSAYAWSTSDAVADAKERAHIRALAAGINRATVTPAYTTDAANTARILARDAAIAKAQEVAAASTKPKTGATQGVVEPIGYRWNLPPHSWSLPVRPSTLEPDVSKGNTSAEFHQLRRGRIWFWAGAEDINAYADDGSVTTIGAKADAAAAAKNANKSTTSNSGAVTAQIDTNYGFQFLWNPTTVSSSVMRNMEITPSNADRLKAVAGAFPGQETVSFNIVIDRINDFACIKAADAPATLSSYYTTGYPGDTSEPFSTKIDKLIKQGTMADLEYLFRAINGGSTQWKSLLGKETANIGFLMPTLLGMVLGPDITNSLSYVGWLTGLTMQHEMFTENMVPLRTTVSINMECFAGSGIVSS